MKYLFSPFWMATWEQSKLRVGNTLDTEYSFTSGVRVN